MFVIEVLLSGARNIAQPRNGDKIFDRTVTVWFVLSLLNNLSDRHRFNNFITTDRVLHLIRASIEELEFRSFALQSCGQ
jgi:hypothetical protein